MDVLLLKLSTKFMKGILAKIVSKKIYKKLGYKVDIQFNGIQVDTIDNKIKIHIDVDGTMGRTEFERLMEKISDEV